MEKLVKLLSKNKNTVIFTMSLLLVSLSTLFLFWNEDLSQKQKASITHLSAETVSDESWRSIIPEIEKDQFVMVINSDANLVHLDQSALKTLNYEQGIAGEKLFNLIHPNDLPEVMISMIKVMQSAETVSNVGPFRVKVGSKDSEEYRSLIATFIPVTDKLGKVTQLIGIYKDITETLKPEKSEKPEEAPVEERKKIRNLEDEEGARKIVKDNA